MRGVPNALFIAHLGHLPCGNESPLVVNFTVVAVVGVQLEGCRGRKGGYE